MTGAVLLEQLGGQQDDAVVAEGVGEPDEPQHDRRGSQVGDEQVHQATATGILQKNVSHE